MRALVREMVRRRNTLVPSSPHPFSCQCPRPRLCMHVRTPVLPLAHTHEHHLHPRARHRPIYARSPSWPCHDRCARARSPWCHTCPHTFTSSELYLDICLFLFIFVYFLFFFSHRI